MENPASGHTELKQIVSALAIEAGALRVGYARCDEVDAEAHAQYLRFIAEGRHGAMKYMENHLPLRLNPAMLLEDGVAQTLIVCAFPYYTPDPRTTTDARFATYARGTDYHTVLRQKLSTVTEALAKDGYASRICIDSAPLRERYWATRAGVGFIGLNSQLIVPGMGSYFFLATVITDAVMEADEPCTLDCGRCGRCVEACPGGAIGSDGSFDARKCLSYLTIEYRDDLPPDMRLGRNVYGCDACQQCCPHNRHATTTAIEEFQPRPAVMSLTRERIGAMTRPEFNTIFAGSAVKRTRLEGLKRNAAQR